MQKLGFLFLTLDNVNKPEIWDKFFKSAYNYGIYIHPKYPENVTWNTRCIIDTLKPTKWGYIVEAYIELYKAAYADGVTHFIVLSESDVPLYDFTTIYEKVIASDVSCISTLNIKKWDYSNRLAKPRPRRLIKHLARSMLVRSDVKVIINADMSYFIDMHVGDEFYLSILCSEFCNYSITHDDWEYVSGQIARINKRIKVLYEEMENERHTVDMSDSEKNKFIDEINKKIIVQRNKKNKIQKSPKTINKLSKEDIKNIQNTKSMFYRKFTKTSDISIISTKTKIHITPFLGIDK